MFAPLCFAQRGERETYGRRERDKKGAFKKRLQEKGRKEEGHSFRRRRSSHLRVFFFFFCFLKWSFVVLCACVCAWGSKPSASLSLERESTQGLQRDSLMAKKPLPPLRLLVVRLPEREKKKYVFLTAKGDRKRCFLAQGFPPPPRLQTKERKTE